MRSCSFVPTLLVHVIIASGLSFPSQGVAPPVPVARGLSLGVATPQTARLRTEDLSCATNHGIAPPGDCALRIILINDIYELQNWPRFQTAVRALSIKNTAVILAGDFVGPSLLSSYDNARGMIDTMNRCGIQYVCFGNHEADIPHSELIKRIAESNFSWINSNIPDLNLDGLSLPTNVVINIEAGGNDKRVALLGLVTEDPGLYQPNAFNGATILPVTDTAEAVKKQLLQQRDVDLIIPITHQSMVRDREFAKHFQLSDSDESANAFPLVVGGHDHVAYSETVAGSHIVKTSCDLHELAVCDIVWPDPASPRVEINTTFVPIATFEPDPDIENLAIKTLKFWSDVPNPQEVVAKHLQVLSELDQAPLFTMRAADNYSSKNNRLHETKLCTRLASETRDALGSECCLLNAGNIRGNKHYKAGKPFFSYNDLRTEVPFDCEMVVVSLSGKVLEAAVAFSRRRATERPPHASGAFLHLDDRMRFDPVTQRLTHVAGEEFDPSRLYQTALLLKLLTGVDSIRPLTTWAKEHAGELLAVVTSEQGAPRRLKGVLIEHWSRALWWEMRDALPSSVVGRDEVEAAAAAVFALPVPPIWLDNLFVVADPDESGSVEPSEVLGAALSSAEGRVAMLWDGHSALTRAGLRACASHLFSEGALTQEAVHAVWQQLGPAGALSVPARAVAHWMASQTRIGQRPRVPGETSEREELRVCTNHLQTLRGSRPILRSHSFGREPDHDSSPPPGLVL